jgi:hypothetical protein
LPPLTRPFRLAAGLSEMVLLSWSTAARFISPSVAAFAEPGSRIGLTPSSKDRVRIAGLPEAGRLARLGELPMPSSSEVSATSLSSNTCVCFSTGEQGVDDP